MGYSVKTQQLFKYEVQTFHRKVPKTLQCNTGCGKRKLHTYESVHLLRRKI